MLGGGGMFRLRGLFTRCTRGLIREGPDNLVGPDNLRDSLFAARAGAGSIRGTVLRRVSSTNTLSVSSVTGSSLLMGFDLKTAASAACGGGGGVLRGFPL